MTLALKHIPIDQLEVSKQNMRHGRKPPVIDDIYPSIKKRGVLKPMLIRKEGESWGVVAGRRRLYALRRKEKETGEKQKAPCAIMEAGDDVAAIEASIIENTTNLPPDEFQQYDAFKRLADKGADVEDIAETFGVTALKVRRILALAGLTKEIKALYEAEEIDGATLRAMTLASRDQQKEWLRLYRDPEEYAPRGERLKDWLTGGGRIATEKALFDVKDYDGAVIADLFGENEIFGDADLFWSLQNAAIAKRAADYREKGWSEVVVLERGAHFIAWDHQKRTKKDGGKVFIETRHDGSVTFHEGYLSSADAKKIERILNGESKDSGSGAGAVSAKAEMSGPMAEYIALHRAAAARVALVDQPGIALRLALAHLIAGSSLWRVDIEAQRTRKETTAESLARSESESLFSEACADACGAVGFNDPQARLVGGERDARASEIFAKLLLMEDGAVMRIFAVAMAETLAAGTAEVEAAICATGADIEALWSPDEAFFDLLRDKRVVNAMLGEIAGERTAAAMTTETAKAQKAAIINRMKGVGGEARPDWRPRWMRRTPARYIEGAPSLPVDLWDGIAVLFRENEPAAAPESEAEPEPVAA